MSYQSGDIVPNLVTLIKQQMILPPFLAKLIKKCLRMFSKINLLQIDLELDLNLLIWSPVWPVKNRQMSIKVVQTWFH